MLRELTDPEFKTIQKIGRVVRTATGSIGRILTIGYHPTTIKLDILGKYWILPEEDVDCSPALYKEAEGTYGWEDYRINIGDNCSLVATIPPRRSTCGTKQYLSDIQTRIEAISFVDGHAFVHFHFLTYIAPQAKARVGPEFLRQPILTDQELSMPAAHFLEWGRRSREYDFSLCLNDHWVTPAIEIYDTEFMETYYGDK